MPEPTKTKMQAHFEAWAQTLGALLSQIGGEPWEHRAAQEPEQHDPAITFLVKHDQGLKGRQWLSLGAAEAGVLLRMFLGEESEISGRPDETQQEALLELFRQWAGLAATQLKPTFGEVSLGVEIDPEGRQRLPAARMLCAASAKESLSVMMELGPDLLTGLDRRQRPRAEPVADPGHSNLEQLLRDGNFDLLLEVELGVTLRFGSRRAPLREVLELTPGAVLELNREIHEPVDLMLNERVIARGDVVVVDGSYGLQITEVITPEQRFHSL